ncbi:exodeoxyribonuclease VII small subunit [bacterium (Candidatus Blackallbacteria) CG17_big_fil_post_rev_8_21_14_2_50_48_46]|uniref:Exodeoxyribonuclease 7 small subunit n=1 Tax=bacterium (Candidatus Blackallbacteria) CG17_big_fil_post_rev_8_21_14_2_50_48_46 TaxID=2014261 RepID=A0A2M7G2X6_9BACT|nr:MAG: exodeoxyribonuclease VII small subunit [bacterium (Candidatus Blackallbacteria) CG18_big_fil_WC_8_21_14_2_50_49_26]PIW16160.1 MAG: exodeoxyribonuclease VII small subunit [bacterium (Candidatus Blackallbacteria) CG17_big_fil_post_rev_8_21_14_2_50_48_46]PIW44247.1 MAG: exodeoxyribonuclease VII small subunit [bacterium (Candidatus Blackallbacteria) CG13_big_fil_rev_8_21_14_2_50_49_14]
MTKKKPVFEESLAELEKLVQKLEGEIPLADAIAAFEKGQALISQCETQLQEAEQSVKQLVHSGSEDLEEFSEEPFF